MPDIFDTVADQIKTAPKKDIFDEVAGKDIFDLAAESASAPLIPLPRSTLKSTITGGTRVRVASAAETLGSLNELRQEGNQRGSEAFALSKETMDAVKATPGVLSEVAGAEDALLRTAGSMATPEGALMVASGGVAPKLTTAAFALYGATQAPAAYRETKEAIRNGKPGDIGKALMNDAVTTVMMAAPLAPRTVAALRDTMETKLPSEPAGTMTERLTAKGESPTGVEPKSITPAKNPVIVPTVTPPIATAPEAMKEPWQMTKDEWASYTAKKLEPDNTELKSKGFSGEVTPNMNAHYWTVRHAVESGKPVPSEVLSEYPDLKPAEAKDIIGPGAQTAGQPMPPAIRQLTDAFKGLEGERLPFRTKVERAFDIGKQLSTVKDAVGRALSGLKAGGEFLIQKFQGYGELDDLLKAKGELSAATEQRGYLGMKWAKEVTKRFPDIEERKAITSWVDVGGDMAKLQQAASEVPASRKAPYVKAQNLSPDALVAAQNIQSHFEAKLQEAIDAGVLEDGIEDYIHRIYERAPAAAKAKALGTARSGILSTNPSLVRKRVFDMDFEAEKAGYLPVKDFIPRILDYETSLNRAIAARKFVAKVAGTPAQKATAGQPAVKAVKGMTTADGSPMVVTAGKGIPIEDASGVRQGTLIKPSSVSEELLKNYVHRDYPALNRWKWAGQDAAGKPIMLKGDLMIHKDYVKRFDRLLKPSFVREYSLGRGALALSSTFKQTMLDFSGFHQVQMAVHGAEHRVLPWQITKEIDFTDPKIEGLLKGGMTLGGDFHLESEGLYGNTLSRMIPVVGKWAHDYHQYLFRDFIPRLKTTMALDALERNRKVYAKELASGKMSEDDLHFLTAREANAAFGELNYTMLERSKGLQDVARLTLLAPDFLEARARFAGQAITRHGAEQRAALFLGALVMYTTARLLNKVSTGDYHFEPENLFSLVKGNKSYSLRTVQGDILHLWDNWAQFVMHRLNPITTRPLFEIGTGRNEFGVKRSKLETLWDTVSNLQPISTRTSANKTLWESMMAGFGVNTRRYKETTNILKLASDWKKANKIGSAMEMVYDPDKDPYHKLNLALADNDDGRSVAEIKRLIDTKTKTASEMMKHFELSASRPIAGSTANDAKFLKTLTEDQKKAFLVAQQYRRQMPLLFKKALGKYNEAKRNPNP